MRIEELQLENGRRIKLASLTMRQVEQAAELKPETIPGAEYADRMVWGVIATSMNNAEFPLFRGVYQVPDGDREFTVEDLKSDFDMETALELRTHVFALSGLRQGEANAEGATEAASQSPMPTMDTSAAA